MADEHVQRRLVAILVADVVECLAPKPLSRSQNSTSTDNPASRSARANITRLVVATMRSVAATLRMGILKR